MTMPNFFVVGAQKAGTTSLYHYLNQHPQVFMSPVKEPHFFEGLQSEYRRPGRRKPPVANLRDYEALFSGASGEIAVGEASASYLYSPEAPVLIRRSVPEARIIAVLRDPAERAYSNFLHVVQVGREPLADFAAALQAEEGRMRDNWGPLWYYEHKGFYYAQVKRYLETFGRDQVGIWLYEDLRDHPTEMMREIFCFLAVDETFVPQVTIEHNPSGLPRNEGVKALYNRVRSLSARNPELMGRFLPAGLRTHLRNRIFVKPPPFPPDVRSKLRRTYREDILKLQELIGRDLSPWLMDERGNPSTDN
jgi:hypothetical protein